MLRLNWRLHISPPISNFIHINIFVCRFVCIQNLYETSQSFSDDVFWYKIPITPTKQQYFKCYIKIYSNTYTDYFNNVCICMCGQQDALTVCIFKSSHMHTQICRHACKLNIRQKYFWIGKGNWNKGNIERICMQYE